MLSGSSELGAAFPAACVNLQLDTSSFTCFSLGHPPLPPPLLPQPGNKLSEIKGLFNFLLSQHPKPRSPAPLLHSLACPIPVPTPSHPPWPCQPWREGQGWSRVAPLLWEHQGEALSARAVPCPQKGCFIGKRMESCFIWAPSFLLFPLFLSFSVSLSFPSLFLISFLSLLSPLFYSLTKAQQLPGFLWGKCKYPSTNST